MFNEASFAVSQNTLNLRNRSSRHWWTARPGDRYPAAQPLLNPLNIIPQMTSANVQNYANPSMPTGTPYFNQNTIYSLVDNISKIYGTHTSRWEFIPNTPGENSKRLTSDIWKTQLQHRQQQPG